MQGKTLTIIALTAFSLLGTNFLSADTIDLSTKHTFEGTVTPAVTMDIKYGLDGFSLKYRGFIDYVMPAGTFFRGPVYDAKNKVVKKGDIIAAIGTDYVELQYQSDIASLDSAKAALENKQNIYETNQRLFDKKSVSQNAYITSKADYLQALSDYKQAETTLKMTRKIIDEVCTMRARFDGIVNKVKFSGGWAEGLPPTLNISQLNPIYIVIPMDRNSSIDFNYNTPVTVYPNKKGGTPVGYLQGQSTFSDGKLSLLVNNQQLPPPVSLKTSDGKDIPVIKTWCPIIKNSGVSDFHFSDSTLVVSKEAIFEDNGSKYVWLAEGSKTGIADSGMDYLRTVKKIEVKDIDHLADLPSYVGIISFTPKDGTQYHEGNILLSSKDCPPDLNDSDTVCLYAGMYTFMPGESVKVEIGPTSQTIK